MRPLRTFLFSLTVTFYAVSLAYGNSNWSEPRYGGMADTVSRENVEEALFCLKSAYERREIMPMMDLLDRNFERYLDFKYEITKKFFFSKQLELMFIIDSILQNRDRVSVRLHWFKKTLDPGGVFYKKEGSSQFVFRNSRRGLKLLYIRGDNPFF